MPQVNSFVSSLEGIAWIDSGQPPETLTTNLNCGAMLSMIPVTVDLLKISRIV